MHKIVNLLGAGEKHWGYEFLPYFSSRNIYYLYNIYIIYIYIYIYILYIYIYMYIYIYVYIYIFRE